jgi:hypothetical protein
MTMSYELHEFCLAFRRANAQELAAIVEDMHNHGYDREQAVTLYEGKILDGATRDSAAGKVGVEPTYTTFTGSADEAIAFVLRRNKLRKHMSVGELDLAAGRLVKAKRGGQPGNLNQSGLVNTKASTSKPSCNIKTIKMVAEASGRSAATIDKARVLLKKAAPHIIAMIEAGEVSSTSAYEAIIGKSKDAQAQLTTPAQVRKAVAERRSASKPAKTPKPVKAPKPISSWRMTKLRDVDIGSERIPGQPVMLQPAYVQRLTEAAIRVRGLVGRVEGLANTTLDEFEADIKRLLAHAPVKGKKNGEERNYASETEKMLTSLAKHIDAALERLSALRVALTAAADGTEVANPDAVTMAEALNSLH